MPESVAAAPETLDTEEEDKLIAEELGYPVPPAHAFVTETMAELYLAQGFRDRAISVYRQLVEIRPDDERLRNRLAELEQPGSTAEAAAESTATEFPPEEDVAEAELVEARRVEEPSVESPEMPRHEERTPSIETPTPSPEVQAPSEESGAGQTPSIDSPPSESPEAEPESVESIVSDEPSAQPEGFAEVESAPVETVSAESNEFAVEALRVDEPRGVTVREFFANLGKRKPASRLNGTSSNGSGRSEVGWSPNGDSSSSDAKAAAALAGAFGGAPAATSFAEAPPSPATGKESEEDVARFRAWLDGLTT